MKQASFTDEEVLRLYANMVYRLALVQTKNKTNAEDIMQDVFLRYVQTKKVFISDEHIKAWFIRVTLNCCHKQWRSAWFRKTTTLEENTGSLPFVETLEEKELLEAVASLKTKYRVVIHMFYFEELSIKEMSKILRRPESTISSQLCRARKLLKEQLKEEYEL